MDDQKIIEMYFMRDEQAIAETKSKYGRLLNSIAYNILGNSQDSEECEDDTYLRAWNTIPPTRPGIFSAYLAKITRNLALNRLRSNKRRAPLSLELIFEEIENMLPDGVGDIADDIVLRDAINEFLESMDSTKRKVFVKRYFLMRSVSDIAMELGMSVVNVKVILSRQRIALREYLERRGVVI